MPYLPVTCTRGVRHLVTTVTLSRTPADLPRARDAHMPRRPVLAAFTALSVAVSTALLGAGGASAAPPPTDGPTAGNAKAIAGRLDSKLAKDLVKASGTVTAFVQLDAKSGSDVTADGGDPGRRQGRRHGHEGARRRGRPAAADRRDSARSAAPKRIGTLTNLVPARSSPGDAAQVRALADSPRRRRDLPGDPARPPTNANTVAFTARPARLAGDRPHRRGRPHRRHRHRSRLHARRLRRPRHRRRVRRGLRHRRHRPDPGRPVRPAPSSSAATTSPDRSTTPTPPRRSRLRPTSRTRTPTRSTRLYTSDNSATARTSPAPPPGYGVHARRHDVHGRLLAPRPTSSDWQIGPGTAPEAPSSTRSRSSVTSAARPTSRRSRSTARPTRTATATLRPPRRRQPVARQRRLPADDPDNLADRPAQRARHGRRDRVGQRRRHHRHRRRPRQRGQRADGRQLGRRARSLDAVEVTAAATRRSSGCTRARTRSPTRGTRT